MPVMIPDSLGLACRIVVESGTAGAVPPARIELTNCSTEVLDIECCSHPLEFLDLIVTDSAGEPVSRGKYGDLLIRARREKIPVLQLGPGETRDFSVSLFATVPPAMRESGLFTVQAVFEYGPLKAISAPVQVAGVSNA